MTPPAAESLYRLLHQPAPVNAVTRTPETRKREDRATTLLLIQAAR
jgi:hypothetical protein